MTETEYSLALRIATYRTRFSRSIDPRDAVHDVALRQAAGGQTNHRGVEYRLRVLARAFNRLPPHQTICEERDSISREKRPDIAVEHEEVWEILRGIVDDLEPRMRQVVRLRYFEDRTLADIACELRCGRSTIQRILTEVLDLLKWKCKHRGIA